MKMESTKIYICMKSKKNLLKETAKDSTALREFLAEEKETRQPLQ